MHPFGGWPALTVVLSSGWSSDAGLGPTTSDVVVDDDTRGFYLVARGLGPEPERTQAVHSAAAAAMSLLHRSIALDPRAPLDVLARLAVEDANGRVWREFGARPKDVGVVLTLLLVRNERVVVGHVGHGRVLRIRGGLVTPLTTEHTVRGEHHRLGYPTPAGAEGLSSPLTRQLGERMFVDVDVDCHPSSPTATYVLLSSGFESIDMADELDPLVSTLGTSRAPAKLIEMARARGQRERLSALVVQPVSRAFEAEGEVPHRSPSLGSRLWESLQRGVSRIPGRVA